MKLKHSRGPWYACCKDGAAHFVFGRGGDETICQMSHNDPNLEHYERLAGTVTMQERRANARLIGTAPEMLEELIKLYKWLPVNVRSDIHKSLIERATGMTIDEVLKGE